VYHSLVHLVLASASPRRAELLSAAGFSFAIAPAEVDERRRDEEPVEDYVGRLAVEKSRAVALIHPAAVVLGADTAVVVGDEIFGKPADDDDAARMLAALSGKDHVVWTGLAVILGGETVSTVERSVVRFSPLSPQEIAWYVATGEPRDKAGAYAVQGLASRFIEQVRGSYSNVVGLPVSTFYQLLRQLGVADPPGLRRSN
jgi:septum formation protein